MLCASMRSKSSIQWTWIRSEATRLPDAHGSCAEKKTDHPGAGEDPSDSVIMTSRMRCRVEQAWKLRWLASCCAQRPGELLVHCSNCEVTVAPKVFSLFLMRLRWTSDTRISSRFARLVWGVLSFAWRDLQLGGLCTIDISEKKKHVGRTGSEGIHSAISVRSLDMGGLRMHTLCRQCMDWTLKQPSLQLTASALMTPSTAGDAPRPGESGSRSAVLPFVHLFHSTRQRTCGKTMKERSTLSCREKAESKGMPSCLSCPVLVAGGARSTRLADKSFRAVRRAREADLAVQR